MSSHLPSATNHQWEWFGWWGPGRSGWELTRPRADSRIVSFGAVWIWAVRARGLLAERVDPTAARTTVARFTGGNLAYLALVGLAFVSAPLTLVGHFLLAVYYVFNRLPDPS